MEKRELVIIGAGPAGLTAAIYAKRAGLDVLLIEKGVIGGQINLTDDIANWPGTISASGMELAQSFRKHAEYLHTEIRDCSVVGIDVHDGKKIIVTDKGSVGAEAVILATGSNFRKLGCKGEAEFTGAGVSYCAVCDAAFFQDADVAVVGGGNAAVEEAIYLTKFASKVYLIHRRDEFRADKIAVDEAMSNPKIFPVMNNTVESIEGSGLVNKIVLHNVANNNISDLSVSGVFIFVGNVPNVSYLGKTGSIVKQTPSGWVVTDEQMRTSVEGIYAAGDLREKTLRQVVTAASDGAVAAMAAHQYISGLVRLRTLLLEPEHVNAFFSSGIISSEVSLRAAVEKYSADAAAGIICIDTYRNMDTVNSLGIAQTPSIVELKKGKIIRKAAATSVEEVKNFLAAEK